MRKPSVLLASLVLVACSESGTESAVAHDRTPPSPASLTAEQADFGSGFVVWESSRDGHWRLWRRHLGEAGSGGAEALTAVEPGRAHCCAHISPDGERLAYLALPAAQAGYPESGASGELRLLDLVAGAAGPGRVLAAGARTYFEHRAAVWKNDRELIHIDAEGRTVLLDVENGSSSTLIDQPRAAHGWLIDPTLSYATRGEPTFSAFDAATGRVDELAPLGGCQPYFSRDGRLGVWVAGAGGPIRAIDLATRRQWPILGKGDRRLAADRRYLYFPMPAADGRALAWAASDDQHDHTRADYDVFVAETDADTLELIGPPVQVSRHPATDRFPDVWLAPLELGRHAGEAPLSVRLEIPAQASGSRSGSGDWRWRLGDGGEAAGASLEHTWSQPGRFEVTARRGEVVLRGQVHVRPAAPPRLLAAEVRSSGELWLRFDEAVSFEQAEIHLASGSRVVAGRPEGEQVWVATLDQALERPTELTVRGVRDRAAPPNVLRQASLTVEPARWPVAPENLVFLWQSARHPNRVAGTDGEVHTTLLEPVGRAWVDRLGAMVLRGGAFQADVATMDRLFHGLRASNELSLELSFQARPEQASPAALFGFAAGSRRNLVVTQEGDRLRVRLRTPSSGQGADRPVVDVGRVTGSPQTLLVTYTPGRLRAYLDGEPSADSAELRSGFFHWQRTHLRLGAIGPSGGDRSEIVWPWHGSLEGVAVYDRVLDAEQALESSRRRARIRARRDQVRVTVATGRLLARSETPSLEAIAPYREALAVFEYQVEAGELGGQRARVVHRVLLDGQETPIAGLLAGSRVELRLEPFSAQPQLESLYLSDQLPATSGELYWSDRLEP